MPIFGARELKLFLLVKRKYTIGNKYFLIKWGCVRYVANVLYFYLYKKAVRFKSIPNKLSCKYWVLGLSDLRTIETSNYRTFGLSGLRTIGPSDYWAFGLLGRHPFLNLHHTTVLPKCVLIPVFCIISSECTIYIRSVHIFLVM